MPFNEERVAATYAKEILRYISGSEIKVNCTIDGTQVALNGDGRRIIETGTVLVWTGTPKASKVKPAPDDGSVLQANVAGILETTYELWPGTTSASKDDKPAAMFIDGAHFETTQLLGYSSNAAAVKAALPGCRFYS